MPKNVALGLHLYKCCQAWAVAHGLQNPRVSDYLWLQGHKPAGMARPMAAP